MPIKNLGYRTDCIVREFDGTVVLRDNYFVIRMPSNPTCHWGNLLLFQRAPQPGDYKKWIDVHEKEFGLDSGHVTFGWESQEVGEVQEFEKNGFSLQIESVLSFQGLTTTVKSDHGFEIRKIESDEEWRAVEDLQVLVGEGEAASNGYIEFKKSLFRTYREMSKKGCGNWWGAFVGDTLVGDMGLYFDGDGNVGRFQSEETHPSHRRKGVCTYLLDTVLRETVLSKPGTELVICASVDSEAGRIYGRSGFRHREYQHGVLLPCPYEKRFEQVGSSDVD